MDTDDFRALRDRMNDVAKERKEMQIENRRNRRPTKKAKLDLIIAGQSRGDRKNKPATAAGTSAPFIPTGKVFEGKGFCVLSEAVKPLKRSKVDIEDLIKEHGGNIYQRPDANKDTIVIADKKVVKVASLIKTGSIDVVRPIWLLDCINQTDGEYLLPYEMRHLLHGTPDTEARAERNTDGFGDSFARDVTVTELKSIFSQMDMHTSSGDEPFEKHEFLTQLEEHGRDLGLLKSTLFQRCHVHFAAVGTAADTNLLKLRNWVRFGGGTVDADLNSDTTTHVVIVNGSVPSKGDGATRDVAAGVRKKLSAYSKQPRVVRPEWIEESWKEGTVIDEERYAV